MAIQPQTFYYHFKRNPELGIENGAYYILGLGMHSEKRDEHYVVLKPLYFCDPRKTDEEGISFQVRPLEFFTTPIDRDSYRGPRFVEITDPATIEQLKQTYLFNGLYLEE